MCFPFIGGKSPYSSRLSENQRDSRENAAAATTTTSAAVIGEVTTANSASTSTTSLNGDPLTYEDPAKLHHQLRQKERELKKREEENQSLREQLISKVRDEEKFFTNYYRHRHSPRITVSMII